MLPLSCLIEGTRLAAWCGTLARRPCLQEVAMPLLAILHRRSLLLCSAVVAVTGAQCRSDSAGHAGGDGAQDGGRPVDAAAPVDSGGSKDAGPTFDGALPPPAPVTAP